MPRTRDLFLKKYGVDAYASPENAARVAGLHLRDDYRKTGSIRQAVRRYHGGPDESKWGPVNRAYDQRVNGGDGSPVFHRVGRNGAVAMVPGKSLKGISWEDVKGGALANMGDTRRGLGPETKEKSLKDELRDKDRQALMDRGDIAPSDAPNWTIDRAMDRQARQDAKPMLNPETGKPVTSLERFEATFEDFVISLVINALAEGDHETDPKWVKNYGKNFALYEGGASEEEREDRRHSRNADEYFQIVQRQERERARNALIDSGGHGTAWRIGAALYDPVNVLGGLGVEVGFAKAGIGAANLAKAGRTGAAVASMAGENAVANLAITGVLDAAGEKQSSADYVISGLTGAIMGVAISPLVVMGHSSANLAKELEGMESTLRQAQAAQRDTAIANVGPEATPGQIDAEVTRLRTDEAKSFMELSLADVPDDQRLLSPEVISTDKALAGKIDSTYNVSGQVSDAGEVKTAIEHIARAEAFEAANPMGKAGLKTILASPKLGKLESTGLRLLNDESVVMRTVGRLLLESTTGAGGRRATAAMQQMARERIYNGHLMRYDELAKLHRQSEGGSLGWDLWDGRHRKEFDRRVFREIERRGGTPDGTSFDPSRAVVQAADDFEAGMDAIRMEMQHVDAVGAARLGDRSRGYLPHRLDAAKVVTLSGNRAQLARVQKVLERQFMDPSNGFVVTNKNKITGAMEKVDKTMDGDFAKKLSVKYLERALERARGGHDVPANLHSPEAAEIVRDALTAMNLGADATEDIMGKYSRGGASFTKKRLRLNLNEDIGDGMVLGDLFNQDIVGLYRSYARRASGEVALAQYGIMGKHGLDQLRRAAAISGASPEGLEAFDQIASEFLNTPFGKWHHKNMDNARVLTSAARLGGMAFTQFAEYGNAIAHVGVLRTLSAIGSFGRLQREVGILRKGGEPANPILASIDRLGGNLGLDDYRLTRMFDVKDNDIQMYGDERLGLLSRGIRAAGHLQSIMSAHRIITAVQTRGMAEQIVRKAIKFIKDGAEDIHLDDMGIDARLREAIRKDLGKIATFDKHGNLETLDITLGDMAGHDVRTFREAIERGASQIIQRTYIGETGKWAHNGFLKMLFQFRTFSITSVEKQWGRGVAKRGGGFAAQAATFATLMGAMSFAAPIHLARVHWRTAGMSPSDRDKYIEENANPGAIARATMNYASASGLAGDISDVGGSFANSYAGDDAGAWLESVGVRGGNKRLSGGVFAPAVGLGEDIFAGVGGTGKGPDLEKLLKAMPGANLPFVMPLITGITAE